jgi:tRNA A37 methylthiotransferase MiaB
MRDCPQAYSNLVSTARATIGANLSLSSDFIAGFCGETEEDHEASVKLIQDIGYDQVHLFLLPRPAQSHARALRRRSYSHTRSGNARTLPTT